MLQANWTTAGSIGIRYIVGVLLHLNTSRNYVNYNNYTYKTFNGCDSKLK